jgi:N-carbamoyl-L-amino-acid hydrolase
MPARVSVAPGNSLHISPDNLPALEEANLSVTVDRIGNIFARRASEVADAAPVMIGSHLDTQVYGGRFDGILRVLPGLE